MIELLERQKKLTANQWKLICTANLADLLDFFDLFLIGYVTAALTKQWSLTYLQGGLILLASGIGAPPGAFFWGWLGDRIGRRTVFILSAITISLAQASWSSRLGLTDLFRAGCSWYFFGSLSVSATPASTRSTCRSCRNSSRVTSGAGSARWLRRCCRRAGCWPDLQRGYYYRSLAGVVSSWSAWCRWCWCS